MDNRYTIVAEKHDKVKMEVSCNAVFEMAVKEICVSGPEGRFFLSITEDVEGNTVYRSEESIFELLLNDYLTPAQQRFLAEQKIIIDDAPELKDMLESI